MVESIDVWKNLQDNEHSLSDVPQVWDLSSSIPAFRMLRNLALFYSK